MLFAVLHSDYGNDKDSHINSSLHVLLAAMLKTHKYSSLKRISKDVDVDAVLYLVTAG